jgi:hypothetical protein
VLDYYEILEVHPKASPEIIKKAYTLLAKKYHPDVYPDKEFAHKKMSLLNEAYAVLIDPEKRKNYDLSRRLDNAANFSDTTADQDDNTTMNDWAENSDSEQNSSYEESSQTSYDNTSERSYNTYGNYDIPYEQRLILQALELAANNGETIFRPKEGLILSRLNGIGTTFRGEKEYDNLSNSYITTYWFTFLFIPLIPIREYRVIKNFNDSYYIISSRTTKQFRRFRLICLGIVTLVILFGLYLGGFFGSSAHRSSTYSPTKSSTNYKAPVNNKKSQVTQKANGNFKPKQGVRTQYVSGTKQMNMDGHGIVTIDNTRNDAPVYVRIWSLNGSPYPVRCFTIASGDKFSAQNLTQGQYDVRYKFLYENQDAETGSKSDPFNMEETRTETGVRYHEMTLTLYKVRNGNARTTTIPANEI